MKNSSQRNYAVKFKNSLILFRRNLFPAMLHNKVCSLMETNNTWYCTDKYFSLLVVKMKKEVIFMKNSVLGPKTLASNAKRDSGKLFKKRLK